MSSIKITENNNGFSIQIDFNFNKSMLKAEEEEEEEEILGKLNVDGAQLNSQLLLS